ncbi:MAG: RHS repeat-associated core domain-containing protein [Akkermansia sp.]|nr:RHS repeat-associated core domain-containing protein [Akkermansia sp.]
MCEVFGATGYIRTAYTYSPFGSVTATGNVTQPIQWSSEFHDEELGLVYYNWRYFNTIASKWNARDPYKKNVGLSLYFYCKNQPIYKIDSLGFDYIDSVDYVGIKAVTWSTSISKEEKQQTTNIISGAGMRLRINA